MRFAVLSDIHSNLEALTSVLDVIDERGIERVVCLGDVVGYGADPAACVDLVRARCAVTVLGNHDEAVALGNGEGYLPEDGRRAAMHNHDQLDDDQLEWLENLPLTASDEIATFVHATPEDPASWQRIGAFSTTHAQFSHFETPVCFIGHTHVPGLVADRIGILNVRRGHRYLINVGSVGQPRDGDPRACFAIFDDEAFSHEIVRVPYDVERAAQKIRRAGLPERLGGRLSLGA